jgi:hypothetical protein
MRSNTTQQNIWAQLGVSGCALLLPPMALGAAVFSMLPARDEGARRPVPGAAAETHVAMPKFRVEATEARPVNVDSQPVAETAEPFVAMGKPPLAAEGQSSASSPNTRQEPSSKKEATRVLSPVPVRVTIVTPSATVHPPPSADADSATTGSIGTAPWPSAAAEVPKSLLPRIPPAPIQVLSPQTPAPQVPTSRVSVSQVSTSQVSASQVSTSQVSASQVSATQASKADRPSEGTSAPASTAGKHVRSSYLRTLAAHSGAHAEVRSETHAVRRNAQPQPEQTFSFKNWLQQLGTHPRDTRG